jgi:hypothetical protein
MYTHSVKHCFLSPSSMVEATAPCILSILPYQGEAASKHKSQIFENGKDHH